MKLFLSGLLFIERLSENSQSSVTLRTARLDRRIVGLLVNCLKT